MNVQERTALLRKLCYAGRSNAEIARELGCAQTYVRTLRRRHKLCDEDLVWPSAKVAALRACVAEGLSAGETGKRLGVTRHAANLKAIRLGLRFKSAAGGRVSAPRAPKPPKPSKAVRMAVMGSQFTTPKPPSPVEPATPDAPGSATIHTLGACMCKWPIGDPASDGFTFCGRRVDAGPYCVEHARRAYLPRSEDAKRSEKALARTLRRYI